MTSEFSRPFFVRNVRVPLTASFSTGFTWFSLWRLSGRTAATARALPSSPASFSLSFLSSFSFTLCFLSLGFYPLSLFLFSFLSLALEEPSGIQVESAIGVHDFSRPLSALPFSSYTRIRGLTKRDFMGNFVDSLWGTRVSQTRHGSLLLPLIVGCCRYYPRVLRDTLLNIIYYKARNNLSNTKMNFYLKITLWKDYY